MVHLTVQLKCKQLHIINCSLDILPIANEFSCPACSQLRLFFPLVLIGSMR